MMPDTSPPADTPRGLAPGRDDIARVVLAYAVFGALWILLSDHAVELVFSDAQGIIAASILKGWLFVAVTAALLWTLMRRLLTAAADAPAAARPRGRLTFILPLALASIAIVAATVAGVVRTIAHHKAGEVSRLQAIAELKSEQVAGWLAERRADAEFLRSSTFLSGLHARWQGALGEHSGGEELKSRLGQFCKRDIYSNVLLLGRDGEFLWDTAGDGAVPPAVLRAAVRRADESAETVMVGPYRDDGDVLRLDFVVPLQPAGGRPAPVVVLRVDPAATLYAMLQAWPIPTRSGELLLFRRDGDSLLFLSELRHRGDAAAALRLPLAQRTLLAVAMPDVQTAPGRVAEGLDYRSVLAFGAIRAVPGTDWFLAAKLDQAEANAEGIGTARVIALAGALALFVTVVAGLLYRQRQALLVEQRLRGDQAEKLRALQLLAAIADGSEDAIFAIDRENRFILFNRAAERSTGKAVRDVIGRDETALFPTDIARRQMADNRRVMDSGRGESFEETLPMADGERILLVAKDPLRDEQGRVFGLFGISRDITAMRCAEQAQQASEARYRAVLDSAADAVLVAAPDGRLLYANGQAAALLGYGIDELQALGIADIAPPGGAEFAAATFERLRELGHLLVDTKLRRRDAGTVDVEINAVRLPDGNFYGACRDITERKAAEAELRSRNAELERFNRAMVGREVDMIELKRQVNELSRLLGREPPLDLAFLEKAKAGSPGSEPS